MKEIFITHKNGKQATTVPHETVEFGVWVNLCAPTQDELKEIADRTQFPLDYLRAALDEEESPRIEREDGIALIIIDVPIIEESDGEKVYNTIPLGIIMSEKYFVTVCLQETAVISDLKGGRILGCNTFKRTRLLLQIVYKNSQYFLRFLRSIDKKTNEVESILHKSMKNKELIELLNLEKSLVYFSTSLKSNEIVLNKITKFQPIKIYDEDADLLEDVIIENKQAIEMANIYSNILSGMMDAFASIINNNMNRIMKILASVTIIISIPTMIASFFGMNVPLPFQASPLMTIGIIVASLAAAVGVLMIMMKKEFI